MSNSDKKNNKILIILTIGFLILLPIVITNSYILHIFINTFIAIIFAVSLRLVLVNGLLSFGHGAFAGIGAYTSALLMMRAGVPFLLSLPVSGLVAGLVSGVIAFPALRVRGAYFVILTWAIGEVFVVVYKRVKIVFGGASGLYGIPGPEIFGFQFTGKDSFYYLALLLMLFTIAACYRIGPFPLRPSHQGNRAIRGTWRNPLESISLFLKS